MRCARPCRAVLLTRNSAAATATAPSLLLLLLATAPPPLAAAAARPPLLGGLGARERVDPWIGTGGFGFGVGGNPPGAQRPFGLVKFSPDTAPQLGPALWEPFEHYGGASWLDDQIRAFSLTHMAGPGALDLGAVGIMPIGGVAAARELHGARAAFRHGGAHELATPGYYKVRLAPSRGGGMVANGEVDVELTATLHAAVMRLSPVAGGRRAPHEEVGFLFDPRHCLNGPSAALNRSVEVGVVSAVFGAPSRPPPFLRAHWVPVPKALRTRRVNRNAAHAAGGGG